VNRVVNSVINRIISFRLKEDVYHIAVTKVEVIIAIFFRTTYHTQSAPLFDRP